MFVYDNYHSITLYFCIFLAPSASPQSVEAIALSPTSIMVFWDEPPVADQNGIITQYRLQYRNLNNSELEFKAMNTSGRTITLESLEEYEEYQLRVAAMTEPGRGPYSTPILTFTLQDGM